MNIMSARENLQCWAICLSFLVLLLLPARAHATSIPDLTEEEHRYLGSVNFLTLVCDPSWPPYDFIDDTGKHSGMAADYLKLISQRINKPIHLIPTQSWSESLQLVKTGKADLVSLLNSTPEREHFLNFTPPVFESDYVIIGKKQRISNYDIEDIEDRTLAIVRGYKVTEHLRRDYPTMQFVEAENTEESLFMINRDEAFATVTTEIEATHFIRKNKLNLLGVIGSTDYINAPRLGIPKGNPLLTSIMTKSTNAITDEERRFVLNKWMTGDNIKTYVTRKWVAAGIVLMLVAVFLFWYRRPKPVD